MSSPSSDLLAAQSPATESGSSPDPAPGGMTEAGSSGLPRPAAPIAEGAIGCAGTSVAEAATTQAAPTDSAPFFGNYLHYQELARIGHGAYGTVYKARNLANDGQIVALKKVPVTLAEEGVPMSTLREIALLKQLDQFEHPNIVRLLDICDGPRLGKEQHLVLCLIFEFVDQDLATYIERCPLPGFSSQRIKEIMHQILCGVDFLHTYRIVHRDLKPQNLLVTKEGNVKLADFGLAKTYDYEMKLTSVVMTLWYRAPEVLLGLTYSTAVDMWSVGAIMGELLLLKPIFRGSSEGDQLDKIFRVIGTPPPSDWSDKVSLNYTSFSQYRKREPFIPNINEEEQGMLQRMLKFDPHQRICAADALLHPYFRDSGFEPLRLVSPANRSAASQRGSASSTSKQ